MRWLRPVLLVIFAAGAMPACGNGGDGSYDFNGVWSFAERVGVQQGTWSPFVGQVTIAQNDREISLSFPGQEPATGLCDPEDGTFTALLSSQGGRTVCSYTGHSDDDSTLSGSATCSSSSDGSRALLFWTAELIHR